MKGSLVRINRDFITTSNVGVGTIFPFQLQVFLVAKIKQDREVLAKECVDCQSPDLRSESKNEIMPFKISLKHKNPLESLE